MAAPQITALAHHPHLSQVACGYSDGTIRLWNITSGNVDATFAGHRSAVSTLKYAADGSLLASGGRDTDIVIWDVVSEAGLYRLKGHRGQVSIGHEPTTTSRLLFFHTLA